MIRQKKAMNYFVTRLRARALPLKCTFVALLLGLFFSVNASASEAMLRSFFDDVASLQADFEQQVVDETGFTIERSRGVVYLSRPGKFRWDYLNHEVADGEQALSQQILADGEWIYLYDPELEQVTQRSLQDALGQVPSLLLVQTGANVDQHFLITDFGVTDDLSWVALKPKDVDAAYQQLMIGFNKSGLAAIQLLDGLGNETKLVLSMFKVMPRLTIRSLISMCQTASMF